MDHPGRSASNAVSLRFGNLLMTGCAYLFCQKIADPFLAHLLLGDACLRFPGTMWSLVPNMSLKWVG